MKEMSSNRTRTIKINILISAILKIVGMGISFILVPITTNYLGNVKYGVWATLLGIISWVGYFDIGLGNGLRNKLTEALTKKEYKTAKEYVATTYFSMFLITLVISCLSLVLLFNLSWQSVFNTTEISEGELVQMMLIAIMCTLINFILSIYNQLFYSIQKSSFTGIGQLLNGMFNILFLTIISKFTQSNLVYLAIIYCLSMIFTSVIMTYIFFRGNKEIIPTFKDIRLARVKEITNLGIKFFLLQISALIIYTTDNMIVTQMLGPGSVTSYSIVRKLFNVVVVVFSMIQAPLWSAYTEAYYSKDYYWIKSIMKKNIYIFAFCSIGTIILALLSPIILRIWIGTDFEVDIFLIFMVTIYTILALWGSLYTSLLNGIGKINLIAIVSIISAVINIPLSIVCIERIGVSGVVLGTIISMLSASILEPLQARHIIKEIEHQN